MCVRVCVCACVAEGLGIVTDEESTPALFASFSPATS